MRLKSCFVALVAAMASTVSAQADVHDVSIQGSDAIYLAGRTDIGVIPAIPAPFILARHGFDAADFVEETFPPFISVVGGDVVYVVNPAVGGINFFNGLGPPFFGPEGNVGSGSNLNALGGISGYLGTQGALVGVFLDATSSQGDVAPATLDFSTVALRDFTSVSPVLGQVFFIGDGVTSANVAQQFIAPTGATRLFLGIPDGFAFNGPPGAYEDNDGTYRIRVGINEIPAVPVPAAAYSGLLLLAGLGVARWVRRRAN
jgi:hypothetical protein